MIDNGFIIGLTVGIVGGIALASNYKVRHALNDVRTFVMDKYEEVAKKMKNAKGGQVSEQCHEECDCNSQEAKVENN